MYTVLFLPRVIFAFLHLSTVSSRHDFVQTQYWLKWIDTFSKKHTYLKTSFIYLRIVLISISLNFVGPLATRAKWTIIKRGQIIPCRYWVKQQIDIVIINTPECFNSFSISFHVFVSQWFLIRHSSHLIRNPWRAKMILLIN